MHNFEIMLVWGKMPFVRFLLPFLFGILITIYLLPAISVFLFSITALLLIIYSIILFSRKYNANPRLKIITGIILTLLLIFSGILVTQLRNDKNNSRHYENFIKPDSSYYFTLCITETPIPKKTYTQVIGQLQTILIGDSPIVVKGKLLLYIPHNAYPTHDLEYGNSYLIHSRINEVNPPKNPNEFDYKQYLSYQNIFFQGFMKDSSIRLLSSNKLSIFKISDKLRNYFLNELSRYEIKGNEFSVLSALLLGYENDLSPDLIKAYSSSGALHVLSVSGLHVAIIFLVFEYFLSLFSLFKKNSYYKMSILLSLLWMYALLTGLSPSVLRSATMLSFVIIGKTMNRSISIYNSLAASAFFLLVINPFLIMDVGFQLSYLAVLGIILLHKPIYQIWVPSNWLVDKIWSLSVVSISAQLVTFPLGLLYFHQFPNYFLASNLFVIPISTIILYSGMLFMTVSKISFIAYPVSKILNYSVLLLNKLVIYTDQLPYSILTGIHVSIIETSILYITVITWICWFMNKKNYLIYYMLLSFLLFVLMQVREKWTCRDQKEILIYSLKKHTAIDFFDKNTCYFLCDTAFKQAESKISFFIQHNRDQQHIEKIITLNQNDTNNSSIILKNNFIQFYTKRFWLAENKINLNMNTTVKTNVDAILITANSPVSLSLLKSNFNFKKIILDSSNSMRTNNKWKKICMDNKIEFYSIIDSGAYIEKL